MDLIRLSEKLKDNTLIITVICYACGFLHFSIYYGWFNIPILYYTSLTDVLLYILKIVVILILYSIFCELVFKDFLGPTLRKLFYKNISVTDEDFFSGIYTTISFVLVFTAKFTAFYVTRIDGGLIAFMIAPLITNYMAKKLTIENTNSNIKFNILFLSVIVSVNAFLSIGFAIEGREKQYISFSSREKVYDTGKDVNLYYLGETSSHIFILNDSLNLSMPFNKSEILDLKYRGWIKNKKVKTNKRRPDDRG